jgi:hypothetical protein
VTQHLLYMSLVEVYCGCLLGCCMTMAGGCRRCCATPAEPLRHKGGITVNTLPHMLVFYIIRTYFIGMR